MRERESDGWSCSLMERKGKENEKNLKNEISSMALAKRMRTLACIHTDTCALILFLNLSEGIERRKTTLGVEKRQNMNIDIFIHRYFILSTLLRNCSPGIS
jgi:hypothetical protein